MLSRALELKEPIAKFLKFYKSPQGKREFSGTKTKLVDIEEKEWAIIDGICHLLGSFNSGTKLLSGEKYSSFVCAFPVLRSIKGKIGNESLFVFPDGDLGNSKFKTNFYGQYGNEAFFDDVVRELSSCRKLLLCDFTERFSGMDADVMWTTLLDPRFSLKSGHWKDETERTTVKNLLIRNVEQAAVQDAYFSGASSKGESSSSNEEDSDDENGIDLLDGGTRMYDENQSTISIEEKVKAQAKQEVLLYLIATESIVKRKFDPLDWWKEHKRTYPHVAALARKWLSVPGTSTPSERVFSICGIVNSAKRSRLSGKSIENQVLVHNNKALIE